VIPAIGHARALALLRRGQFRDSYGPEISAAEASRRLGRPDLSYGAWSHAACAAACAGDFDRALDFVDRGLADLADSGFDILVFHLLAGRAHALGRLGRAEEALRAARQQRGLAHWPITTAVFSRSRSAAPGRPPSSSTPPSSDPGASAVRPPGSSGPRRCSLPDAWTMPRRRCG
jgi:hypothetical protein